MRNLRIPNLLLWAVFLNAPGFELHAQDALQQDVIHLAPGDSSTAIYTNKETAFYYAETGRLASVSFQGFNVFTQEYLEDYLLLVNGKYLDRRTSAVDIYPDRLVRRYHEQGLIEEAILFDSLNVLGIRITSSRPGRIAFAPVFSGSTQAEGYAQKLLAPHPIHAVALKARLASKNSVSYPAWVGVASEPSAKQLMFSAAQRDSLTRSFGSPSLVSFRLEIPKRNEAIFYVMVGKNENELIALHEKVKGRFDLLMQQRQQRILKLLEHSEFESSSNSFNKAVRWAKVSLDALIMNQQGKGIFAGLPWFNNYWGRDTFISLPGAALVTGNYAIAREILLSFSRLQLRDPKNPHDGRIPNRAMPGETIYNTADGTPWFIRAAHEYVLCSGDRDFAREIMPTLSYAVEAALRNQTDRFGLFIHGDAETWMDAVGPQGPWSPRGSRAVEIQALWFDALLRTAELAEMHSDNRLALRCRDAATVLQKSFQSMYWQPVEGRLVDHLDMDGSPDQQIRPNQIFAVSVPHGPLLNVEQSATVTAQVVSRLTYPYGVASLDQLDDNFHPYHHYAPFYVQDAAYHNGIVWTWLSGPLITALCRFGKQDLAYELMYSTAAQILERGTRGTQSELLEALPRPGETFPRLSGTVTQAWNLAEFIRNLYQDILGVRIDALQNRVTLSPHLPQDLDSLRFVAWVGNRAIEVSYHQTETQLAAFLGQRQGNSAIQFEIFDPASERVVTGELKAEAKVEILFDRLRKQAQVKGTQAKSEARKDMAYGHVALRELTFAEPFLRPDLPALKGPE